MNSLTESIAAPLRALSNKLDGLQSNSQQSNHQYYNTSPPQNYNYNYSGQQYSQQRPHSHQQHQRSHSKPQHHTKNHHRHHRPNHNNSQHSPDKRTHLQCTRHEIRNLNKDLMIMQILRPQRSSAWGLSQRPTITLVKANGIVFGHIRFRSISTSAIELEVNDRSTRMTREDFEDRWCFEPSFARGRGEVWCWEMENSTKGVLRNLRKREWVLARLDGEELIMEIQGMSDVEYDEIVVSGVALVEKGRKGSGFSLGGFGDVVEAAMSGRR